MIKPNDGQQNEMEFVSIEELVPTDHLLRKVEKWIDFEFIRKKVAPLYSPDNGRPAIDPVVLFKMLFIGYLMGIRSERQLVRDIQVNVAYRWFLRMGLRDKVPDASTISQNRRRRFLESTIYQEVFDEVVLQAMKRGLLEGKVLYTDSTHLKANANKNKYRKEWVKETTKGYLAELEAAVEEDRQAHGKGPLPPRKEEEPKKEIKVSTTDPESGYLVREGKPKGFFYLDHRTVDGKHNLITDTFVTAGNVHDSVPYLERLDRQVRRFGFEVEAVGLDAGYLNAALCKGLEDRAIYGAIGYSRPTHRKGYLRKSDFRYDRKKDRYRCPGKQWLPYRTTNREGYREYVSNPKMCRKCPRLAECTQSANGVKVVTRHIWQDSRERMAANRLTEKGKSIYAARKETIERSFADAKQLHGHRYIRMKGRVRALEQCLMGAASQNMKKMALILSRRGGEGLQQAGDALKMAFRCFGELLSFPWGPFPGLAFNTLS